MAILTAFSTASAPELNSAERFSWPPGVSSVALGDVIKIEIDLQHRARRGGDEATVKAKSRALFDALELSLAHETCTDVGIELGVAKDDRALALPGLRELQQVDCADARGLDAARHDARVPALGLLAHHAGQPALCPSISG